MRRKIFIFLLAVLGALIIIAAYVYYDYAQSRKSVIYDDYKIEGMNATYNQNTRTGMVDLKIVYKGGGIRKLFQTSDNVIGNGFDFIVDVGNSLEVYNGKRKLESRGYETGYGGSTQKVRISYVEHYAKLAQDKIIVKVVDSNSRKVKAEIPVKLKVDSKCKKFDHVTGPDGKTEGAVYVSESGVLVDTRGSLLMRPPYNETSTVYLKKSGQSIAVITDPSASMKNTEREKFIKARVFAEDENVGEYIYAVNLEEWNQITQAGVGKFIFKK